MLESILSENLILALLLWAAAYCSDYYLTLYAARLYHDGAAKYLNFGGSYELTPGYQKDINSLRKISPRFILFLSLTLSLLIVLFALSRAIPYGRSLFAFALGLLLLMEAAVHVRHFRNIVTFRYLRAAADVTGSLTYPRHFVYLTSAAEIFAFAGLYLFIYLTTGSIFVLGGVVSCLALAVRHWRWGKKLTTTAAKT